MKKFLSVLLTLSLVGVLLTACSDKTPSSSTTQSQTSSVAQSEPEPELPYDPMTLTGLEQPADYSGNNRLLAVMMANHAGSSSYNARPQWGLSSADMVVEIKTEGGITRLMALFSDYQDLPKIGPVRSARDQFFQLILPWQAVYVHIGESTVQSEFRRNYNYDGLDFNLDNYGFSRDQQRINSGRSTDSAAYTELSQIETIIGQKNVEMQRNSSSTFFDFVNYNEDPRTLTGDSAMKIDVVHSDNYRSYFEFDASKNRYMMSQYSAAIRGIHETVDANTDEQVGFDNVIILFADVHRHPAYINESYDIQQVDYYGGVGYYFNGGKTEQIRWSKGAPDSVLRILDNDGNETDVKINPGTTYLGVVGLDEAPNFIYYPSLDGATAEVPTGDATDYVETDE